MCNHKRPNNQIYKNKLLIMITRLVKGKVCELKSHLRPSKEGIILSFIQILNGNFYNVLIAPRYVFQ